MGAAIKRISVKDGLYRGYSKDAHHRRLAISFIVRHGRIRTRSYHFRYFGCDPTPADVQPDFPPVIHSDGSFSVRMFGVYLNSGQFKSSTRATGFVALGSHGGHKVLCAVDNRWHAHWVRRAR